MFRKARTTPADALVWNEAPSPKYSASPRLPENANPLIRYVCSAVLTKVLTAARTH